MGPKEPTPSVNVVQRFFITHNTKLKEISSYFMNRWKKLFDIPVNNYSDIVIHIDQYLPKNTVNEKIDLAYLLTHPLKIIHECDLCEFNSELRHRYIFQRYINLFIFMIIIYMFQIMGDKMDTIYYQCIDVSSILILYWSIIIKTEITGYN